MFKRVSSLLVILLVTIQFVIPPQFVQAQSLPLPGVMVTPSASFAPAMLKGITVYPDNPLKFNFIVDSGDSKLTPEALEDETMKLVKYFLATITTPEDQIWVNLSPYEKNRIVADGLANTDLGQDLLAQDYILKQLTASLMYPEDELGQEFYNRVRTKLEKKFGITEVPLETFNKVWIVPAKATVYQEGTTALVVHSYLKVMLEEDYLAMEREHAQTAEGDEMSEITKQAIREVIIPEIEREVNEGENFANLRQIYNSMLLATWYKKTLKDSVLGQVYMDKGKTAGIETNDPNAAQEIYGQYLEAFEKGVYNYIREETDAQTGETIPRKYFSGGATGYMVEGVDLAMSSKQREAALDINGPVSSHLVELNPASEDGERMITEIGQFVIDPNPMPVSTKYALKLIQRKNPNPILFRDDGSSMSRKAAVKSVRLGAFIYKATNIEHAFMIGDDRVNEEVSENLAEVLARLDMTDVIPLSGRSAVRYLSQKNTIYDRSGKLISALVAKSINTGNSDIYVKGKIVVVDAAMMTLEGDAALLTIEELEKELKTEDGEARRKEIYAQLLELRRLEIAALDKELYAIYDEIDLDNREQIQELLQTYPGDNFPPIFFFGDWGEFDDIVPKIMSPEYELDGERVPAESIAGGKGAKLSNLANHEAKKFPENARNLVKSKWFDQHESWLAEAGISKQDVLEAIDIGDIRLSVPPGFTVTVEQTTKRDENRTKFMKSYVLAIKIFERAAEKKMDDFKNDPLQVSNRSGAWVSLPGMMDTVVPMGMSLIEQAIEYAESTGDRRFAMDILRRSLQMFGEVVLNITEQDKQKRKVNFALALENLLDERKEETGNKNLDQTGLRAEDYERLAREFLQILEDQGLQIPDNYLTKSWMNKDAVQDSQDSSEAILYARTHNIPKPKATTAVTQQLMVFGNTSEGSGSGVIFSRNTSVGLGEPKMTWDSQAIGEDVVAGRTRNPRQLGVLKKELPWVAIKVLLLTENSQENIYFDTQDKETTWVENMTATRPSAKEDVYILQTRDAKRESLAEFIDQHDYKTRGLITQEDAVKRITEEKISAQLMAAQFDEEALKSATLASKAGEGVSSGAGVGRLVFSHETAVEWVQRGEKVNLIAEETSVRDLPGMIISEGMWTTEGDYGAHAALIARQYGIPAVVGDSSARIDFVKKTITVTEPETGEEVVYKEGDWVSIDGTNGKIYKGEVETIDSVTRMALNVHAIDNVKKLLRQLEVQEAAVNAHPRFTDFQKKELSKAYAQLRKGYDAYIQKWSADDILTDEQWKTANKVFEVIGWALQAKSDHDGLDVRVNGETAMDLLAGFQYGVGTGLSRGEHLLGDEPRNMASWLFILAEHPDEKAAALELLEPYQLADYEAEFITAAIDQPDNGRPINVRLFDPPLHEFVPTDDKDIEAVAKARGVSSSHIRRQIAGLKANDRNPMAGKRGSRLGILEPELFKVQIRSYFQAVINVRRMGFDVKPEMMNPLVGSGKEWEITNELVESVIKEVANENGLFFKDFRNSLQLGTMLEIPEAIYNVVDIAKAGSQYNSIGSNDLVQFLYGLDREATRRFVDIGIELGIFENDPWRVLPGAAVRAVAYTTVKALEYNPDCKNGVCGEHGANPKTIKDVWAPLSFKYVSVGTGGLIGALFAAAKASIEPGKAPEHNLNDLYDGEDLNYDVPEEVSAQVLRQHNQDVTAGIEDRVKAENKSGSTGNFLDSKIEQAKEKATSKEALVTTDQIFREKEIQNLVREFLLTTHIEKQADIRERALESIGKRLTTLLQRKGYLENTSNISNININLPDIDIESIFQFGSEEEKFDTVDRLVRRLNTAERAENNLKLLKRKDILDMIKGFHITNPALGIRGARQMVDPLIAPLYITVAQSLVKAAQEENYSNIEIVLPFVENGRHVEVIRDGAYGDTEVPSLDEALEEVTHEGVNITIGATIKKGSAALESESIAKKTNGTVYIDAYSVTSTAIASFEDAAKTKDGIYNTYRKKGIWKQDPWKHTRPGVLFYIQNAIQQIRQYDQLQEGDELTKITVIVDPEDTELMELAIALGANNIMTRPEGINQVEGVIAEATNDAAMNVNKEATEKASVGGIDLNPDTLDFDIQGGEAISLPTHVQALDLINVQGFVPVIIHYTPVTNLPMFLGFADSSEDTQERAQDIDPYDRKARFESKDIEELSYLN